MTAAELLVALDPERVRKGLGVYLASTGERVPLEDLVAAVRCRSCFAEPFTLDAKLAEHVRCLVIDRVLHRDLRLCQVKPSAAGTP